MRFMYYKDCKAVVSPVGVLCKPVIPTYLIQLILNTKSTSEIMKHQWAIFFEFEVVWNVRPS